MSKVANACDLVDPSQLTQWSSILAGPPQHTETRPSAISAGSLRCDLEYTGGGDGLDRAGMIVDVEFTNGSAPPQYDNWKRYDFGKTGPGMTFGAVTGPFAQGFWHSEVFGDLVTNTIYDVCVLDGNVSVLVTLNFSREKGVPAASRSSLEAIGEAQARRTLDELRS